MYGRKKHSCACSGKAREGSEVGLPLGNTAPSPGRHRRRPHGTWWIWLPKARWFARVNGATPAIVSVCPCGVDSSCGQSLQAEGRGFESRHVHQTLSVHKTKGPGQFSWLVLPIATAL